MSDLAHLKIWDDPAMAENVGLTWISQWVQSGNQLIEVAHNTKKQKVARSTRCGEGRFRHSRRRFGIYLADDFCLIVERI